MATVDLILLVVLLASIALGFWRGLVFEVLSVLGWVAAFFLAQWWARDAAAFLPLQDTAEPLRYAAGFVLVFVGTAFAAALLTWLIKKGIESVGLRPVDRTLGALFGLLRGLIMLLGLALVVHLTSLHAHSAWQTSVGARWLEGGLVLVKEAVPEGLARYFP